MLRSEGEEGDWGGSCGVVVLMVGYLRDGEVYLGGLTWVCMGEFDFILASPLVPTPGLKFLSSLVSLITSILTP